MRGRVNVDVVALVLAASLGLAVVALMVAVVVNVMEHQPSTPTLGANATQVIIAITGGLIGILGSYVGSRVKARSDKEE